MMNVYVYRADLLCEECGEAARLGLNAQGKSPADLDDESTFDSDDYPKGPYPDGGGEADTPQHCGKCGLFLMNSLTATGEESVTRSVQAYRDGHGGTWEVLKEWLEFYGVDLDPAN